MLVVTSPDHGRHHGSEIYNGAVVRSFECPERIAQVERALRDIGFGRFIAGKPINPRDLLNVHSRQYLDFLATAYPRWQAAGHTGDAMAHTWPARAVDSRRPNGIVGQLGFHSFAADCAITPNTFDVAIAGASAAVRAASLTRTEGQAFAMVRPPGHHATRDQFGGYCYINNSAAAAQRLLDDGAHRVAVLDVDYHHGNGTQDIFYARSDVVTCSIHADPSGQFPWFFGYAEETGVESGEGANLNLPLPRGTGIAQWRRALDTALAFIDTAQCDALVVALGVDTFEHDPISDFTLSSADYPGIGAAIAQLAVPTAFVMEGGYLTDALGRNVAGVLSGFEAARTAGV
ncbi:MAG: histone deacetylase family protein [Pseudomonadota bacterium]